MADVKSKFLTAAEGIVRAEAAARALDRLERIDHVAEIDAVVVQA
jgi:hypothetical protein